MPGIFFAIFREPDSCFFLRRRPGLRGGKSLFLSRKKSSPSRAGSKGAAPQPGNRFGQAGCNRAALHVTACRQQRTRSESTGAETSPGELVAGETPPPQISAMDFASGPIQGLLRPSTCFVLVISPSVDSRCALRCGRPRELRADRRNRRSDSSAGRRPRPGRRGGAGIAFGRPSGS